MTFKLVAFVVARAAVPAWAGRAGALRACLCCPRPALRRGHLAFSCCIAPGRRVLVRRRRAFARRPGPPAPQRRHPGADQGGWVGKGTWDGGEGERRRPLNTWIRPPSMPADRNPALALGAVTR